MSESLDDLVRRYLEACFAVEQEAHRSEQPGARVWSSGPVVGMLCLRDDLCRAVEVEPFSKRTLALSRATLHPKDKP